MRRTGGGFDRGAMGWRPRPRVPVALLLALLLAVASAAPAAAQGGSLPAGATAALGVTMTTSASSGTTYTATVTVSQAAACAGCPAVPVPGVTVAFQTSSGILSAPAALTDSQGEASVELTLLPGATATLTATVQGLTPLVAQVPVGGAAPPTGTATPPMSATPVPPPASSSGTSAPPAAPAAVTTFTDIASVPWAVPSIVLLASQGVVQGVGASSFAPDEPVTQEQAVAFLSRLFLAAGGGASSAGSGAPAAGGGSSTSGAGSTAGATGTTGTTGSAGTAGTAGPSGAAGTSTGAAGASSTSGASPGAAAVASGSSAAGSLPPGVDSWAVPSVLWALQEGVVQNASGFQATKPAPRAQVVAWVVRALHLTASSSAVPTFNDSAQIPATYVQDVAVAQADGLVVGDTQGNFTPLSPITRAQVAVLLVRAERALALAQGGVTVPFSWQEETGSAQAVPVAAGSAQTGSTTLPAGTVAAGLLQSTSGGMQESYVVAGGVGAGTVTLPLSGQSVTVPFIWEGDGSGTIWLFEPGASTQVSTYTSSGGTIQVAGSAAPGFSADSAIQVQPGSGGLETASACLGACAAGVTTVTFSGPQLPAAVLDVALDSAYALILFPAG